MLGSTYQLIGQRFLNARPFRYCGNLWPGPSRPELDDRLHRIGDALARRFGLRGLFGVDWIDAPGGPWVTEVNPRYTASVELLELGPRVGGPIGKAILFTAAAMRFPDDGPWLADIGRTDPWELPAFADIPQAGEVIEARSPVMTVFGRADDA